MALVVALVVFEEGETKASFSKNPPPPPALLPEVLSIFVRKFTSSISFFVCMEPGMEVEVDSVSEPRRDDR